MATIFCVNTPPVKVNRHTTRRPTPFGAGIMPTRRQRFEPSLADRLWAAQNLGEPDYDELARQAEQDQRYEESMPFVGQVPEFGRCLLCGREVDYLEPDTHCCPQCDLDLSEASTTNRVR